MELTSKTVVVTGGTSGIGLSTTESLLSHGATVAICGIDDTETQHAVANFADAYGKDRISGCAVDVTDEYALALFIDHCADRLGGIDALVTAAGVQSYGTAADTDVDVWNRTLAVNLTGSFLAVKHAIPHLRHRGHASIVLVSSVQAFGTQQGVASYAVSKAGLNALARSIAVDEAANGLRANAVCPASVDTPMLRASARRFSDGTSEEEGALVDAWGRMHPLGRVAQPSEIGEVIAFLCSERASFLTGAAVPVDGGLTASLPVALPR
uniref:Putative short chain dehydrogenase/reductase n=1 Tax=Mycolicibacterium brisbanense TaxID=146020 RepID=B8R4I2_9MYCO|nr:putative short chain dehydrogenase/reductase [Mycolicibacterium brisbanense]